MIQDSALRELRVGCVQYLNAKPLIHGYAGPVVFEHPSRLAAMLSAGDLDVGLVPVFELFRAPGYRVVDGAAICSRGPVFSVFLACRGELADVATVALDHASMTSSNLLRCLLAEFHGLHPRYVSENAPADARLLIGNQAIAFRQKRGGDHHFLDLGEEWKQRTGLPFVYALWLIRSEVSNASAVAVALRGLKNRGVAAVDEIARAERHYSPEFCAKYLRDYIHYDLGDAEKAGLVKFHELLFKHRLVAPPAGNWEYV